MTGTPHSAQSPGSASAPGSASDGRPYPPPPAPLPRPVFDDHTHLDHVLAVDGLGVDTQLDLATSVGVVGVVTVGTDLASSRLSADLAQSDARVLAAIALHPQDAPAAAAAPGGLDAALAELESIARAEPRVRAIGETGLDYYWSGSDADRRVQLASFERHIDLAKQLGLVLQIHDRDAHAAVVETLERVGAPERTVFHCFSGDAELAAVAAANGWHCSFAGTVTFKNAPGLRAALEVLPAELLLVETDAPYLTPHPLRGRPNASYLMPHTVRAMAAHLDAPLESFCDRLALTASTLYGPW